MKNSFLSLCIVSLSTILVLSTLSTAQAPTLNALPNTVYVGADGKFETAPDIALIQFNISAQADNAKDAYEQAAKQAEATRQVLRSNGIDPKAAEIGFFSVNPQYDWKEREAQSDRLPGYDQRQLEAQGFFEDRSGHPTTGRRQRQ